MDAKERREEFEKQRFDRKRVEALTAMVNTEGWRLYVELLNLKASERQSTLLQPIADGEALKSEHNKGAIYGLIYARDLVPTIIAASKADPSSEPTTEE